MLTDAIRVFFVSLGKVLFDKICGWIGHTTVKTLTFGKVDIDWGDSSESVLAECIGVGVLLGVATIVWMGLG